MDISRYISELLFGNDCVIIPGFGGFVAHYSPAKIHPINHSFYPPSKNILFNSKLIRDDGLLIDFISEDQHMSYAEAKSMVEKFIRETQNTLTNGDVVRFKNIGDLKRDAVGKLLFTPDDSINYLEEAFGLSTFVSPPILRSSAQSRNESKFIDRKPESGKKRAQRKKYLAYAATIPVLLLLGWFVFFGNFRTLDTQQSGIINLSDSENFATLEKKEDPVAVKTKNSPIESLDFSDVDAGENELEAPSVKPANAVPIIRKNYYIIGGAFGIEANADKLVSTLINKGYEAERAGISPSGLHMVSYFRTADKSEALINLDVIRREENPTAWLIRK